MGKIKRRSYTATFKRQVIKNSDENGNRAFARNFGVDESLVRDWRKHRTALFKFKCESKRRAFRGDKEKYPELEKEVIKFIKERRKSALYVSYALISEKALDIAKRMGITRPSFKASKNWVKRFMRRHGFSLRRRTTICQKLPADFEHKLTAFQSYVIAVRQRGNFLLGQIGNADETPICFDMPS